MSTNLKTLAITLSAANDTSYTLFQENESEFSVASYTKDVQTNKQFFNSKESALSVFDELREGLRTSEEVIKAIQDLYASWDNADKHLKEDETLVTTTFIKTIPSKDYKDVTCHLTFDKEELEFRGFFFFNDTSFNVKTEYDRSILRFSDIVDLESQRDTAFGLSKEVYELFNNVVSFCNATTSEPKSADDIQDLKVDWDNDPCWDIESTAGFEYHYQELLDYSRKQNEASALRLKNENEKRREQLRKEAEGMDIIDLLIRIKDLEKTVRHLESAVPKIPM